jgi:dTDP-4-amino-4,6-dideoxygalactose transaminase
MLRWFGVGPGDEVIVPAYTFAATANVVIHCGATPVFVDVADDFNIKASKVAEAVTENTKAIIPVDFAGFPAKYTELKEVVESCRNLFRPKTDIQQQLGRMLILSDSAHALGATYKGHKVGTQADAMVFSFHASKNLTTAEGGAITFNLPVSFDNTALYKEIGIKALHGQTRDAYAKMQQNNWKYDIVEAGYKYNMPDITASLGLVELERYDAETLPKRKAIFEYYHQKLSGYSWAQLHVDKTPDAETSYHIFPLRIHGITEAQRDEIIQHIYAAGIAVNVHFMPVPGLTYYKNLGYDMAQYPAAYDNFSREISLPVFYDLSEEQMEKVISVVIHCVEQIVG